MLVAACPAWRIQVPMTSPTNALAARESVSASATSVRDFLTLLRPFTYSWAFAGDLQTLETCAVGAMSAAVYD